MLELAALDAAAVFLTGYCVIFPLASYFYDPKGLRKYPNYNFLSGITDLSYCYVSASGFRSRDLYEAHKRSPILRIGPNSLSFGDIRAIKDLYGHSTKCGKDLNYSVTSGTHRHLIDSVDKPEHARKRKLMSAAFAIKNLEPWEYKVADVTDRLLKAFDLCCTEPLPPSQHIPSPADLTIDFNKWINLFTIEAINKIALSSSLGLLEQGSDEVTAERLDGSKYKAQYRQAQNQTSYAQSVFVWDYTHYTWLAWLSKLIPKWRHIWREAEPWNDVVYHQAAERLRRYQSGEKLEDFFSSLMTSKNGQPNNLEWGEIVAEISIIINAGADTTAIALSHIMDLLLRHPKHLQTLREEVDNVLDDDEVVAPYDKVKDLPFLRACLDEGLRLIPPTSAGLARRTPTEGARILDEWIPGDTSVSMTIYAAHRDPKVFPEPEQFQPNRWLDPEDRKRMEPYFIPFSTGARGCIGRNISYLEQAVVVASLVHRYDFALPSPSWRLKRHEAFNILVGEMPVKIWRREQPEA
jgi:cytochrome P450